ncbi:MAG: amidohydrolase [Saprospiraceae bacterium]
MIRFALAFAIPLILGACKRHDAPDHILFNAVIFTADEATPEVEAMAVKGDKIIAVGSNEALRAMGGTRTQWHDMQGAFVMPGLIEGHGHFGGLGRSLMNLNLLHSQSWAEIVAAVAQKARQTPKGEWIEGRGWHQEKWNASPGPTVNGYPYHDALSAATPDHPVVLYHASGHGLIANEAAMRAAGVSPETPDPSGGRIVRGPGGRLVGVFEENAMDLITRHFKAWREQRTESEKKQEQERVIQLAAQECLRYGITSFQDAGSSLKELAAYRAAAEQGTLGVRLWAMIGQPAHSEFAAIARNFPIIDAGKGFFTSRAVKAYFDGALGSYGAWLLESYQDKPGFTGQNTTPIDTIATLATRCKDLGLQLCVHAIGDRANREMLDLYARFEPRELRWRIEHAQHLHPDDLLRFADLGVIASYQAIHCVSDAPFVPRRLGEWRSRTGAYAWRSMIDSGAHIANGTDVPVEEINPFNCIFAAVTRRHPARPDTPPFYPEQAMTRREALLSYTIWNAYAAFEEEKKGSISPGKYADFIVLDRDLLRCADSEILEAKVMQVWIAGKLKRG